MNVPRSAPKPRPKAIRNDKEAGRLLVDWVDGSQSGTEWARLRWACPCAECQGEMGYPGRLSQISELADDELLLESLRGVGNYGVQPTWRSGHDTGIFTYELLWNLGSQERVER